MEDRQKQSKMHIMKAIQLLMQLSQLENKMLQFLNSEFREFLKQEKQKEAQPSHRSQEQSTEPRQVRMHSFDSKSKPAVSSLFQQLLQTKLLSRKTQKRQQLKEDPKAIPLTLNLTTCVTDLPVVRRIMEKNGWKKALNFEGDILWSGPDNVPQAKQFTYDFAMVFLNQHISRIPGLKQIANKKETSSIMKKMREYFPSVYNFYPRTYQLPEDLQEFTEAFEQPGVTYIAKPDKGTQGQGIFLVKDLDDLYVNGVRESQNCRKNYIIQEYISNPLLLDNKKFDFRLYVLITSVYPLIAYLNEEGLARLCTEDYEDVSNDNLSNVYMHLTNYSLNKNSQNFVAHPPDFMKINNGTKRTYTAAKKTLQQMGIDIPKLKLRIEQTIARFLLAICPYLQNSIRDVYQDKYLQAKCFHVIGFDILVDSDLKPWVIEINANPSFEVTQPITTQSGAKKVEISPLDSFVKSKVLEDAFLIAIKSPQEQITKIGRGKYLNSYKMILDGISPIENLDLFQRMVELYGNLSGLRYGQLNQMRFCRLSNNPFLTNEHLLRSDYDLIFKKISLRLLQQELSFSGFIEALEVVAEKLLKKKTTNYSIQRAMVWVTNMANQMNRPLTAKRP